MRSPHCSHRQDRRPTNDRRPARQLVISLDTQYAVAHAIYNRFHANGHRKHLTWENLDDDGREPWRLIAKDAITEMLASPEIGGTA